MYTRISHVTAAGVACLLLVGMAVADTSALTPEELGQKKALYQQKLREFKQDSETAKSELMNRYQKTLEALRQEAKAKGDLDAVQAVDKESKRFEQRKILPPVTPPPEDPMIAKAVLLCREAREKAALDGARRILDYTDKYLAFLDSRKKEAVRNDKLELAKAYGAEWTAARESAAYQEAKFLIADKAAPEVAKTEPAAEVAPPAADSGKTPSPVAAPPAVPPVLAPVRIGKDGEKIQPHVDPEGLYDAQHVAEGTPQTVASVTSTSFKQLVAVETGKAPFSGNVGIAMEGCLDNENAKYQLRIKLRNKTTETNYVNLKILVQYFVKNQTGGAIQETRTQLALIPVLRTKNVTCEMKTMDLPYAYTYRFRSGSFGEDREGSFQGVVVSVFSLDDKLLGQVTSANMLKDRGKTTFELPTAWLEHNGEPLNQPGEEFRPRHRIHTQVENNN